MRLVVFVVTGIVLGEYKTSPTKTAVFANLIKSTTWPQVATGRATKKHPKCSYINSNP